MFHSSDKELLTYAVPLLKLRPQDFYAAACGILRHMIARAKRQRLVVTFEGVSEPPIKHAVDTIGPSVVALNWRYGASEKIL